MTCQTCPWFASLDAPRPTCRANPASVYVYRSGPTEVVQSSWPPVKPDGWCAKHPDRHRIEAATVAKGVS